MRLFAGGEEGSLVADSEAIRLMSNGVTISGLFFSGQRLEWRESVPMNLPAS